MPPIKPALLTRLPTPYQLTAPMSIAIETYPASVVAHWGAIEAFGEGATESDAIAALGRQVVALYEELRDLPDAELGPLPQAWKRELAARIHTNLRTTARSTA